MSRPATYLDWLRVTAKGCLLSWRNVPEYWPDAWRSLKEFAYDFKFVIAALLLPLLTPFAPIIAIFLRREYRRQEERIGRRNAEAIRRWAE